MFLDLAAGNIVYVSMLFIIYIYTFLREKKWDKCKS